MRKVKLTSPVWWLSMIATLLLITPAIAAEPENNQQSSDANIIGHVLDKKSREHLIGIIIKIKHSPYGATTDASGHYFLRNLKPNTYTIEVSGVGYKSEQRTVKVAPGKTLEVNFELEEDVFDLNELVVTSNRQQTLRRYAPTLVSVIDDKVFKVANAVSLSQGLTFQPGIRVENNCQNCGFNQVRINGLDGRFSQILIDSRPVFSALAGVYGLEQLPMNMIERVEVVRGGGSALYGSSAIAGVINIITQAPVANSYSFFDNLTLTGMKDPDHTLGFNASIVGADGRIGAVVFGQARDRKPWDKDGDGFSELGKLRSRSLGTIGYIQFTEFDKMSAEIHALQEYRRGGDRMDLPVHAAAVAEQTDHSIYSGQLKYSHQSFDLRHHLQLFASGQIVSRQSYYGGIGEENVGKLGFIPKEEFGINFGNTHGDTYLAGLQYNYDWDRFPIAPAKILLGAEYAYDHLKDTMPIRSWETDKTGKASLYPTIDQRIHNWSQIAQFEWGNEAWSVLLGARLDEHSAVRNKKGGIKPVLSPRATLRYNPSEQVNLRLSYAKGFRAPQVFDEDLHVGIVGGEAQRVFNSPDLNPEYSHSLSLSADTYFSLGSAQANLLVEGFYTRLVGAFTTEERTDKSTDGFKMYERINGSDAQVYGTNLEGKIKWKKLSLQAGITLAKSQWDEAQEWGIRTALLGETAETAKEINTLEDHGPSALNGFNPNGDEIGLNSKEMLRTPNIYGYFTATYSPIAKLDISCTLNYTGQMYTPHVVTVGQKAAIIDRELVASGKRPDTSKLEQAPRWDRLEHTPRFFDLGTKISYDFSIFNTSCVEVYVGMNNILNAFQSDFDLGGNRDSAYIYGPTLPRSIYTGLKIEI